MAPNPFNPTVTLSVYLKGRGTGPARIFIYNAAGNKISEQSLSASAIDNGRQGITWAGTDLSGRSVASGVYLVRVERKGFVAEKRITLLK
jgi:flagellar hook assembly protein FlgD